LITFLISGEKRIGRNNLEVKLSSINKNLSFSTKKWINVDFGFTLLTNITSKEPGGFKLQFKINNKLTNSLHIEAKYDLLIEPEKIKDKKVTYTEEQKAKLIATVYGESWGAENLMTNIPWIYYNLTKNNFNLLTRSSFYLKRNSEPIKTRYRICMYYLGQGNQYKDHKSKESRNKKIKDYCKDSNSEFIDWYKHDLDIIRSYFEKHIFNSESVLNPYYKWEGQGYWGDMDIRMNNHEKTKWARASQYFLLQNKGFVENRYVKEFIAYNRWGQDITTYLCDDKSIEKYFKKNQNNLSKFINNDYSTIPKVHIPKRK